MGNKTIYVKDEALWARAKALAGPAGLSSVIGEALAAFVAREEDAAANDSVYSLHATGSPEPITFVGRHLCDWNLWQGHRGATCAVYLTKGRALVFAVGGEERAGASRPARLAVYRSLTDLSADPAVQSDPETGPALIAMLADQLGADWAVAID